MRTSHPHKQPGRQRERGQIAVFMLIIFQILFVLFAMTLNIALTVHDKINLQNSVDLAAIYGAKKQAEVLNAIAHINYQMRQNYKLLAWRFRIMGSLAQHRGPADITNAWCPRPKATDTRNLYRNYKCEEQYPRNGGGYFHCPSYAYPQGYCDSNFNVCVSVNLWTRGIKIPAGDTQNFCTNQGTKIDPIQPVDIIFSLPINEVAQTTQQSLADYLGKNCPVESLINWLMTQLFLSQFRLDQKDRKLMIYAIYKATFNNPDDPKDLDGHSIKEGVKKTLLKNLTYTNKINFESPDTEFETFSSPVAGQNLTELFKPIDIFPVLEYLEFDGNCSNKTRTFSNKKEPEVGILRNLAGNDPLATALNTFIDAWYQGLFQYNQGTSTPEQYISPLTLGYEKRQNLIVYYGVSVKLPHKALHQLFSPFQGNDDSNTLQLKAGAFAKPFGGRMGPPGSKDPILERQTIEYINTNWGGNPHPWSLKPNYSRFPGDKWGLIHEEANTTYFFHKQKVLENWTLTDPSPFKITNYMNLTNRDPLVENHTITNPLLLIPASSHTGSGNRLFSLRLMELMAVAPDVFDMLNYSIFNNYMDTYFPKICRLISKGGVDCKANQVVSINPKLTPGYSLKHPLNGQIRGDFGYPHSYEDLNLTKVKNPSPLIPFFFFPETQVALQEAEPDLSGRYASGSKPPWIIKDPAHLLTGFVPTVHHDRYSDFNFDNAGLEYAFMKCYKPTKKDSGTNHIPYGCAEGGRSGYSVKLVSCDIIRSLPSATKTPTNLATNYCPP